VEWIAEINFWGAVVSAHMFVCDVKAGHKISSECILIGGLNNTVSGLEIYKNICLCFSS
jgi:hypothetical protein